VAVVQLFPVVWRRSCRGDFGQAALDKNGGDVVLDFFNTAFGRIVGRAVFIFYPAQTEVGREMNVLEQSNSFHRSIMLDYGLPWAATEGVPFGSKAVTGWGG